MPKTLRLPTLAEIEAWVREQPQQYAVCGSATRCLIAKWLYEHNPGLEWVSVYPCEPPQGGDIAWRWQNDDSGPFITSLPGELNTLALRFDALEDTAPDWADIPPKEVVLRLF